MIDGNTEIIAHLGYPTHSFKAPMIYNPYFEQAGINAVVVPIGVKAEEAVPPRAEWMDKCAGSRIPIRYAARRCRESTTLGF